MRIITPSRLHFGFLDLTGEFGRKYGSIGVALALPGWEIEIMPSSGLSVEVSGSEAKEKIFSIADNFYKEYGITPKVEISVKNFIPFHKGLGAGTQLSLAVSEGLLRLYSIPYEKGNVVKLSNRGKRSGVGIMSYFNGGFNIDAGKKGNNSLMPLPLLHFDFPEGWVFLVVNPSVDVDVHGVDEEVRLAVVDGKKVNVISRIVLMKLLPALMDKDIVDFGEALTLIQRTEGEAFAGAQGGIFAHDICAKIIDFFLENGAYGAGQSSWGPVVYALIEKKMAERLRPLVSNYMKSIGVTGDIWISSVTNRGRLLVGD